MVRKNGREGGGRQSKVLLVRLELLHFSVVALIWHPKFLIFIDWHPSHFIIPTINIEHVLLQVIFIICFTYVKSIQAT